MICIPHGWIQRDFVQIWSYKTDSLWTERLQKNLCIADWDSLSLLEEGQKECHWAEFLGYFLSQIHFLFHPLSTILFQISSDHCSALSTWHIGPFFSISSYRGEILGSLPCVYIVNLRAIIIFSFLESNIHNLVPVDLTAKSLQSMLIISLIFYWILKHKSNSAAYLEMHQKIRKYSAKLGSMLHSNGWDGGRGGRLGREGVCV